MDSESASDLTAKGPSSISFINRARKIDAFLNCLSVVAGQVSDYTIHIGTETLPAASSPSASPPKFGSMRMQYHTVTI
jgi:hypothetical protein